MDANCEITFKRRFEIQQSIPIVGPVYAAEILAEIDDISRLRIRRRWQI